VGDDYNIYVVDGETLVNSRVTDTDDIWSIAIAENGSRVVYTPADASDSNIYVLDVASGEVEGYPIRLPEYSESGNENLQSPQYADALSFDYTGRYVVFDFLNCLSTETSSCDSGGGYQYWSIGVLDVTDGSMSFPFPDQSPNFDIGYPAFARNNSHVIAVDLVEEDDAGDFKSQVVTVDFENQEAAVVHDFGTNSSAVWGTPSFWGDDDYVTIQMPDSTFGSVARRVALATNGDATWEGQNGAMDLLNDYAVALPLMHRNGVRTLTGGLYVDSRFVDFGEVNPNSETQRELVISNLGNNDVNIVNFELTGSRFSHNGVNTPLPRGASVTLSIGFEPGVSSGVSAGTLVVYSDLNEPLNISLAGNVGGVADDLNADDSSSSGGGAIAPGSFCALLMLWFTAWLLRRKAGAEW
jgi:hypothetical protein